MSHRLQKTKNTATLPGCACATEIETPGRCGEDTQLCRSELEKLFLQTRKPTAQLLPATESDFGLLAAAGTASPTDLSLPWPGLVLTPFKIPQNLE